MGEAVLINVRLSYDGQTIKSRSFRVVFVGLTPNFCTSCFYDVICCQFFGSNRAFKEYRTVLIFPVVHQPHVPQFYGGGILQGSFYVFQQPLRTAFCCIIPFQLHAVRSIRINSSIPERQQKEVVICIAVVNRAVVQVDLKRVTAGRSLCGQRMVRSDECADAQLYSLLAMGAFVYFNRHVKSLQGCV